MRTMSSILTALTLLILPAIPAFAQEQKTVTQTFKLTLYGDVPQGESFFGTVFPENSNDGIGLSFCGAAKPGSDPSSGDVECIGGGKVYTETVQYPAGTAVGFSFERDPAGSGTDDVEVFHKGTATISADEPISAYYRFGGSASNQLGDTGTGIQQEMVTQTFKLTLYGDVPEGTTFSVRYDIPDTEDPITTLTICGPEAKTPCEGAMELRTRPAGRHSRGACTTTTIYGPFIYGPLGYGPLGGSGRTSREISYVSIRM